MRLAAHALSRSSRGEYLLHGLTVAMAGTLMVGTEVKDDQLVNPGGFTKFRNRICACKAKLFPSQRASTKSRGLKSPVDSPPTQRSQEVDVLRGMTSPSEEAIDSGAKPTAIPEKPTIPSDCLLLTTFARKKYSPAVFRKFAKLFRGHSKKEREITEKEVEALNSNTGLCMALIVGLKMYKARQVTLDELIECTMGTARATDPATLRESANFKRSLLSVGLAAGGDNADGGILSEYDALSPETNTERTSARGGEELKRLEKYLLSTLGLTRATKASFDQKLAKRIFGVVKSGCGSPNKEVFNDLLEGMFGPESPKV